MLTRLARGFLRREDGGASIEMVLVLPVFLAIVGLVVDASMIFFRQGVAYRVVQDANRSFSLGRFDSVEQAQDFILASLSAVAPSTTALATVANGVVTTTVQMPASELQVTGLLSGFDGATVTVTASHVVER